MCFQGVLLEKAVFRMKFNVPGPPTPGGSMQHIRLVKQPVNWDKAYNASHQEVFRGSHTSKRKGSVGKGLYKLDQQ